MSDNIREWVQRMHVCLSVSACLRVIVSWHEAQYATLTPKSWVRSIAAQSHCHDLSLRSHTVLDIDTTRADL